MTLTPELTYEFRFKDAYLYYCAAHDCLRVTEDHQDNVLCQGITQKNINDFIECYFEYVLDDAPLKEYFKERLARVKAYKDGNVEEYIEKSNLNLEA